MAYKRKTEDVYEVQQYTGSDYGWECVTAEASMREAFNRKKEYRENQPEYPVRIVKKRVRLTEEAAQL